MDTLNNATLLECTTSIIAAYVCNNTIQKENLATLIAETFRSLAQAGRAEAPTEELKPAVAIKRSVQPDHIVCLEDGKKFKSLKRHLMSHYNMTPQEYREKWGLPVDYPMVAPNYALSRSELAKKIGLGQQRKPAASAELARATGASSKKAPGANKRAGKKAAAA
jgi:predicted transcriptional regulator